jgi:hypothetical protein
MYAKQERPVFHPEHDDYLRVGADSAQTGEIAVTIEINPVESLVQVPRMPFLDAPVAVGLRLRDGRPGISGCTRKADPDPGGRFSISAVDHLCSYPHGTSLVASPAFARKG